jgi:F0F1-type ATP synthase membrane subunit c/vacuolar-type H+-ATPase subunit K
MIQRLPTCEEEYADTIDLCGPLPRHHRPGPLPQDPSIQSNLVIYGFLGVQLFLSFIVMLLILFNVYMVDYGLIYVCVLNLNGDKLASIDQLKQENTCQISIDTSILIFLFTLGLWGLHFYVDRTGKIAHYMYASLQKRYFMGFAFSGLMISLTGLSAWNHSLSLYSYLFYKFLFGIGILETISISKLIVKMIHSTICVDGHLDLGYL